MKSLVRWMGILGLVGMSVVNADDTGPTAGMMSIGIPVFPNDRGFKITAKKMLADDSALEIGIGLFNDIMQGSGNDTSVNPAHTSSNSNKSVTRALVVSVGNRRYIDKEDSVAVFWVPSGFVAYQRNRDSTAICSDYLTPSCSDTGMKSHSYSVGAGVSFGGEYFVSKRFSIEGSVSANVSFFSQHAGRKSDAGSSSTGSSRTLENQIGTSGGRLLVNYYWK